MPPFIVNTHGRLQEWIAHEKGYFKQAGLENYTLAPHSILTKSSPKKVHTISHIENDKMGAYQTMKKAVRLQSAVPVTGLSIWPHPTTTEGFGENATLSRHAP